MRVAVVGCGYVGLVTAIGLARAGAEVRAIEVDAGRLAELRAGRVPFSEPGLALGGITFEGRIADVAGAEVVFVAVPTASDGADETEAVVREVAAALGEGAIVAVRGTVPPDRVPALAAAAAPRALVMNPEFLRQGHALEDFLRPHRVVFGGAPHATRRVAALFAPLLPADVPVVHTDAATACLAKLAANSMLAARVAYANEVGRLAAACGASMSDVVEILGADPRIGPAHLATSLGFGGACLPKDADMLAAFAERAGVPTELIRALGPANAAQLDAIVGRVLDGLAPGAAVAVWGQTFKAGTDDVRASAAVALVARLRAAGLVVRVHDPHTHPGDPAAVVEGADRLVVATAWPSYGAVDPAVLRPRRASAVDPARVLPASWAQAGWILWPAEGRAR